LVSGVGGTEGSLQMAWVGEQVSGVGSNSEMSSTDLGLVTTLGIFRNAYKIQKEKERAKRE
jgi:hypothetical protein